jgi:hypothetical protein
MNGVFHFERGALGTNGHCVYRRSEFSLEYVLSEPRKRPSHPRDLAEWIDRSRGIDNPRRFLLIGDTLTLVFEGSDFRLTSLDAYTNIAKWERTEEEQPPEGHDTGALILQGVPSDTDRWALKTGPVYEFSEKSRWLRVSFEKCARTACYQVGSDLLVRLKDARIAELVLLNIQIL